MAATDISKASTPEELKKQINPVQNITGFHQITIDEYLMAKQEIEVRLHNIADNYIAIGFCLRQIMDSEAYRQEGYTSINDFAKKEYGLSESAVSRFIAINIRFSAEGYSDKLLPEYKNYGSSKLSEMLTLSDEDCRLIVESTTVATIRELKKFNKEAEQQTTNNNMVNADYTAEVVEAQVLSAKPIAYSDFEKVIIEFFRNERELLNEIYQMSDYESIVDRINPSGSMSFRKKIYMLFMYGYGEGLILKKMGKENTSYTWQQFIETTVSIYKDTYTDHDTVWENFYKMEAETEKTEITQTDTTVTETENIKSPKEESVTDEKQDAGKQQENYQGNESIIERAEKREEKHIPAHDVETQRNHESRNKGEDRENKNDDKTDNQETSKAESVNAAETVINEGKRNEETGSSEVLATSQENKILSLRRWYMENRHISLDMGVKQEIADRLCIRITPEDTEKIAEFIEELAVEYTAYVYKNIKEREENETD